MAKEFSETQSVQEEQYQFPYHYVPQVDSDGYFSQVVSWSWGMKYLAGLEFVLAALEELEFESVVDVGCGDGRFLREFKSRFPSCRALGIDYSQRAVALATAMNPSLEYVCADIVSSDMPEQFDVATMVEVLEHIPADGVDGFLKGVRRLVAPGGRVVLTVPHKNKPLQDKHYQHFTASSLDEALRSSFEIESIVPFDGTSRVTMWLARLLGHRGESYLITNRAINSYLYRRVLRECNRRQPEERCSRLLAIASVPKANV